VVATHVVHARTTSQVVAQGFIFSLGFVNDQHVYYVP
jgi:hypothetical protein